jgi:hypothetical protein
VRLEFTISDNYSGSPVKKTVSMLVLSGEGGMIRTSATVPAPQNASRPGADDNNPMIVGIREIAVQLNVDATVRAFPDGRIRATINFQYTPALTSGDNAGGHRPANLSESLNLMLRDGQSLMVSQSADPVTDRRVTVELTATVIK